MHSTIFSATSLLLLLASSGSVAAQELISDVTTSGADESKALQIKAEKFWSQVLQVAESAKLDEHTKTYERVEKVIGALPPENSHVAGLMREALTRVKRADETVFRQRLQAEQLSTDSLTDVGLDQALRDDGQAEGFGAFGAAIRRFVTGEGTHKGAGMYPERLHKQIMNRQDQILPLLEGTAKQAGNVLEDCRLGTKLSFDVRKYDIYNRGVPKTPKEADDAADELIRVSGEVRRSFTSLIVGTVKSIAADTETKAEKPSVTVIRSAISTSQRNLLQRPGATVEENVINLAPKRFAVEENLINL